MVLCIGDLWVPSCLPAWHWLLEGVKRAWQDPRGPGLFQNGGGALVPGKLGLEFTLQPYMCWKVGGHFLWTD